MRRTWLRIPSTCILLLNPLTSALHSSPHSLASTVTVPPRLALDPSTSLSNMVSSLPMRSHSSATTSRSHLPWIAFLRRKIIMLVLSGCGFRRGRGGWYGVANRIEGDSLGRRVGGGEGGGGGRGAESRWCVSWASWDWWYAEEGVFGCDALVSESSSCEIGCERHKP